MVGRRVVRARWVRHPIAAFIVLCMAINRVLVLPPLRKALDVLPLGPQGSESVATLLGVTGAAFLVTAAADGRTVCATGLQVAALAGRHLGAVRKAANLGGGLASDAR